MTHTFASRRQVHAPLYRLASINFTDRTEDLKRFIFKILGMDFTPPKGRQTDQKITLAPGAQRSDPATLPPH